MQISRYQGDQLARAENWAHLPESDLKRRASVAANERDETELWNLVEAYTTLHGSKGTKISAGTLRKYREGLRSLLSGWQGENLLRPTRDAGTLYIRKLEANYAPATVEVKLASARGLYRALRWSGATAAIPFENVKAAADPTPDWEKRQAYSTAEIETLLNAAEGFDALVVLLGAHAGLRIDEMASLKWTDIQAERLRVKGKGGKERRVMMSERLEATLAACRNTVISHRRRDSALVLPWSPNRIRERFKDLCERANVHYKSVHSLRHSAGTRLYQRTGDLNKAASHLGHANIQTTRRYAKVDAEALKASLRDW